MMRKTTIIILLVSLLVLSSCGVGSRVYNGPQTTNYFTGTQGLTVEFLDQAPPDELFETSEFDVQLYVHNKGAFSLNPPYVAVVDLTYDTSKVTNLEEYQLTQSISDEEQSILDTIFGVTTDETNSESIATTQGFFIEGKNINWMDGEQKYISLARFEADEIFGKFQKNTVSFIAQLCYPYQTKFATEVCIDTDTEGTSQREEVCENKDTKHSGQGAPIAITAVESQMIPRGVYVQPQFTIHIEQKGNGVASYRDLTAESYNADSCENIPQDDINKLYVRAQLGGDELNCLPNDVILKGGKAKILCQLTQDKILGVSSNYFTTLQVDVGYIYSDSFRKDIIVHKSDGTFFEDSQDQEIEECFAWQTLDETTSKCVNTCDYKAEYHRDYVEFQKISTVLETTLHSDVEDDYLWTQVSCNYKGSIICKDNPNLCLLQNNLCPPGDFCGLPQCLLKNTPPRIADRVRVGDNRLSFNCVDNDDAISADQTCGCIPTAYYGFINKSESCTWPTSYVQTSPGIDKKLFGIQHNIDGIYDEENKNKRLCIIVQDKLNANATLSLTHPFV